MKTFMRINMVVILVGFIMLFYGFVDNANANANDININIIGKVLNPTCQINNGNTIEVVFDDIPISGVSNVPATSLFQKTVTVPVTCNYKYGNVWIVVTGTSYNGMTNVLKSDTQGLGIALFQGKGTSTQLNLGKGQLTNGFTENTFTFTAVPVNVENIILKAGSFNASANMEIYYD